MKEIYTITGTVYVVGLVFASIGMGDLYHSQPLASAIFGFGIMLGTIVVSFLTYLSSDNK
jgi:hypothetical protein